MRSEPVSPWAASLDRLRGATDRGRRWFARQALAARLAMAAAAVGVPAGLIALASTADEPGAASAPLYEGRHLSSDDLMGIALALDAESIPYASDPSAGRIAVRLDRKSAAMVAIAKHKAAPRTLEELGRDDEPESPWSFPGDRERREKARLEQTIKRQIEGLDAPIVSATVRINREKARGALANRSSVEAYVYLQTREGRPLGSRAIEGVETFLLGAVPGLKATGITVTDQTGYRYLAKDNAQVKEQMKAHSQEGDLQDKITQGLRHIPNVGVSVLMESVTVLEPSIGEIALPPAAEQVVTNKSLQVGVDPSMVDPMASAPLSSMAVKTRANVWVRVPRSFYLMAAQALVPGRGPSPEDLQQVRETTERVIKEVVDASIPKELQGEVKVATVQDDLAAPRALVLPPGPEPARPWLVPALAGAGCVLVAGSMLAGALIKGRKPPGKGFDPARAPHFTADAVHPGPTERVRELVRLNPEAAAGVLQRWIGQKGTIG